MPSNFVEPGRLRVRGFHRQFCLPFGAVNVALPQQRERELGADPSLELAIGTGESQLHGFAGGRNRFTPSSFQPACGAMRGHADHS